LATKPYEPSAKERPFFEKLAPEEVKTGGLAGPYDITKKSGRYVGWFGIVREVEPDATGKRAVLTVEHKYFDGLTDAHIMAVSFNGSGDFQALIDGPGHRIPLLALVNCPPEQRNRCQHCCQETEGAIALRTHRRPHE
jgi:hypothetical protein